MTTSDLPPEPSDDEMRPEYDFTHGVRGKHALDFRDGYTVTIHCQDGSTIVEHHGPSNRTNLRDPSDPKTP
jgi:hypothetical protein